MQSQNQEINTTCPGCGEHEVSQVIAGQGDGVMAREAFYSCAMCGWFGPGRDLRCCDQSAELARDIRDCMAEDQRRGEPGSSNSGSAKRETKPGDKARQRGSEWCCNQEQGPMSPDRESRTTQESIRDQLLAAKFTRAEADAIGLAVQRSGLTKSKWIQAALVSQARAEMLAYLNGVADTNG